MIIENKRIIGKLDVNGTLYINIYNSFNEHISYCIKSGKEEFNKILNLIYKSDKKSLTFHLPKNEFDIVDYDNKIRNYLKRIGVVGNENKLELTIFYDSNALTFHYFINNKMYTANDSIDVLEKIFPDEDFNNDFIEYFYGHEAEKLLKKL